MKSQAQVAEGTKIFQLELLLKMVLHKLNFVGNISCNDRVFNIGLKKHFAPCYGTNKQ